MRAFVLAMTLLATAASAQSTCPTRAYWPTEEFRSRVEETKTAKADQIAALEEYMFTLVGKDEERKGIRTDGLAILKGGELIYEKYARGYGADKKHILWSVSKTLAMLNIGIGEQKGLISRSDSICKVFKASGKVCKNTFQTVLEMGSGLDWLENYENETYQESSVLAMFYGEGQRDMAQFVASHPVIADPGKRFNYSTGDSVLVMAALRAVVASELGEDFPYTELFEKIGAKSTAWERDPRGNFLAGSHAYMTLLDMARVGYFIAADGCWDGERLLPEDWLTNATTPSQTFKNSEHEADDWVHGWHLWLNRPVPEKGVGKSWPDLPEDTFAAVGHWGQYIYVVPSEDLIVVRTGDDRDASALSENKMLQLAIAVGGAP